MLPACSCSLGSVLGSFRGYLYYLEVSLQFIHFCLCSDRCPKEIDPHIPTVMGLCLKYITFDPNYNYDNEEEEETMDTENGEGEEQGACL